MESEQPLQRNWFACPRPQIFGTLKQGKMTSDWAYGNIVF